MNYRNHPELIERLAAEYALGTLRGPARLRFARLMREDAAVARAVREWEGRLAPMSAAVPEVAPPGRVWSAIETRLGGLRPGTTAGSYDGKPGLWDSLGFWRNLGLITSGFATALLVAFALRQPEIVPVPVETIVEVPSKDRQQSYVATLTDKSGKVVLLAYAARNSDELWLKKSDMQEIDPANQSYELWGLPAGGAPKSLGVLPSGEQATIKLAAAAEQTLKDFPALAVSLEPAGGSKTGGPTGPVLYSGPCLHFW